MQFCQKDRELPSHPETKILTTWCQTSSWILRHAVHNQMEDAAVLGEHHPHWEERVKQDLDRDVALGVIEPVLINTPVTWCARMVVVPKHDGTPRRTVDLQGLNRAFVRQTFHT